MVFMNNKELLNICYKFFNRYILVYELIVNLKSMDKELLSKEEIEKIDDLIGEIEVISKNIPNKVDDYVMGEKEKINNIIKKLEVIPRDENIGEVINKQLSSLTDDYDWERDSHERWSAVAECIDKNEYFTACFDNLSDYELLEFIAQNIQAPFPPQLDQEEFEKLVKVGIENDKREWLWRLAFNYERSNINFDSIVDYFIEIKDGYYIAELISVVGECLDIDAIIDKINDKELILDLKDRKGVVEGYVSLEQMNRLLSKLD